MCLAVPGKILAQSGESLARIGTVDFGGVRREISLALVPDAAVGEYVLVHAGFALQVIDEELARQTLADLAAMGEAEEIGK